jgi:hypothetical protein
MEDPAEFNDDESVVSIATSTAPLKLDPWDTKWFIWFAVGVIVLLVSYSAGFYWYLTHERRKNERSFAIHSRMKQLNDVRESFPAGFRYSDK